MVFPDAVGGWRRVSITRYDDTGRDMGIGYDFGPSEKTIHADVFVYPAPPLVSMGSPQNVIDDARAHLCANAYAQTKADVTNVHPGAMLLEETDIPPPQPGAGPAGKKAVFEFSGGFNGNVQPLRSELDFYCNVGGKWLVMYRFSMPKVVASSEPIASFTSGLAWTIPN